MRKILGNFGNAFVGPLLHTVPLFLLISAAFYLALPENAHAQIWVSSGFTTSQDGTQEIATCSTSAVNPATGKPSPAAADYNLFYASCDVTPSTGAVITSPQCPSGSRGLAPGSSSSGNPTGQCSITFQPQPGITYTLNSVHGFYFMSALPVTVCGTQLPGLYDVCYSDPLGYFSWNITAVINGIYPWAPTPAYPSTNPSNTNNNVTCAAEGGVCSAQDFPNDYCLEAVGINGIPLCIRPFYTPQQWRLATSSAVWTPKCADVVNGAVNAINPPVPPANFNAGCKINATFTPNYGLTIGQAAEVCGFTNFDWQQFITAWPLPSPLIAVGSTVPLTAPDAFLDPQPGGYTYELTLKDNNGNLVFPTGDNAYPFYFNPNLNPGQAGETELAANEPGGLDGTVLSFEDTPQDPCLFGGVGVGTPFCSGSGAGIFQDLEFQTNLVGVNPDGTPFDLGVGFNWNSTCNGTVGGAGVTKNSQPSDPGSGTGRSTITKVNETTNYQFPKAPGVPASTLTFLSGTQVSGVLSHLSYNPGGKMAFGILSITNVSDSTITGPFQFVLDSLTPGVTLMGSTGTFGGWQYMTVPNAVSLKPGQSVLFNAAFSNPEGETITLTPMIYSGSFE